MEKSLSKSKNRSMEREKMMKMPSVEQ